MTASHEQSILGMLLFVRRAIPPPLFASLMASPWLTNVLFLTFVRRVFWLSLPGCLRVSRLVFLRVVRMQIAHEPPYNSLFLQLLSHCEYNSSRSQVYILGLDEQVLEHVMQHPHVILLSLGQPVGGSCVGLLHVGLALPHTSVDPAG